MSTRIVGNEIIGEVPCGKRKIEYRIPQANFLGEYFASLPESDCEETEEVQRALQNPIGSPLLSDLAIGCKTAVIIASDHTRPVPSRVLMPYLLQELRSKNPGIDITILIATGCHRESTDAELRLKFGDKIVDEEKIVMHKSKDTDTMVEIGTLPSGGKLAINRLAVEADLLLSEGFIEPHFFAGFSGGRKSVLPGIASLETVYANHCSKFIDDPKSRAGSLDGNPIHRDMLYAAEKASLRFILNVVLDEKKRIIRAFAGDPVKAHETACNFVRDFVALDIPTADIVISTNGGYPLDQNVYQSVKGMSTAAPVTKKGGVIIFAASCSDGHGGLGFYNALKNAKSTNELLAQIRQVPQDKTTADQWEFQILCKVMEEHTVIMVGFECDGQQLRDMHLRTARDMEDALNQAFAICGKDAKVAVIPDGVSVFAK